MSFQPALPRKSPRQKRSLETVDVILEGATRIFEAHGHEATTNQIADLAGVSIGSLYQYFPHKDALLTALHERHVEEVAAAVSRALEPTGRLSWQDELRRAVKEVVDIHGHQPRLQRLLHLEKPWLERPAVESQATQRMLADTRRWLQRHRLAVSDDACVAATVLRMVESLVHAALLDPLPTLNQNNVALAASESVEGYLTMPRCRAQPADL
jgi:AcrR family transcriptional regulator